MKKPKFNLKNLVLAVLVVYLGFMGWLLWRYQSQAPSRAASALINDISTKGDVAAAYKLTNTGFQTKNSFAHFSQYMGTLTSSNVKYVVNSQVKTGKNAVVSGVVEDLQGKNYVYIFHLSDSTGSWLIDSMFASPQ